ncbi:MAG TPA: DUF4855 domain-containing protein [Thermotogota bacterium]|nr:DUF4855 domain-containing protein [Thermotogota bacterium]HRW92822.1 DUF4855 domain-containing protein [Thermotogota bacterium]
MFLQANQPELGYLKHLLIVPTSTDPEDSLPSVCFLEQGGKPVDWFFDSFLLMPRISSGNFLGADVNIGTTMSSEGDFYAVPSPNPGNKRDWKEAIEAILLGAQALGKTVQQAREKLGPPAHPRNVVALLPYPGIGQATFGELEGHRCNFSTLGQNLDRATRDRFRACSWYVDEFLRRWEEAPGTEGLHFLGFYWPFETVYRGWEVDDHWLLKELKKRINARGYKTFWIPFWSSYNTHLLDDYQSYYFDAAFYQPNYLFYEKLEGVAECARAAKQRNAGFEMEYYTFLDEPTRVGLEKYQRFQKYLDTGVELGYMHGACAWFVGGGIRSMLKDPRERNVYRQMYRFVKGTYGREEK